MSRLSRNPTALEVYGRMAAIAYAETQSFCELVKISGLSPARDFQRVLMTANLRAENFKGYNFTGARFRGDVSRADFSQAKIAGANFFRATASETKWPEEIQCIVDSFLKGEWTDIKSLSRTYQSILIATRNAVILNQNVRGNEPRLTGKGFSQKTRRSRVFRL